MKQNILIIGSGGREHAIAWKLAQSERVGKIYAIPGNAGMAEFCECHGGIGAKDLDKIIAFIVAHPDLYMTVVAPDDPLAMGLVDRIEKETACRAFGPRAAAAEIEASKVVAKNLMKQYGIPTARYETFCDYDAASRYLDTCPIPVVIKADGLALGKGVLICTTREEAKEGLRGIMCDKAFGSAGNSVVIEEFLSGFEVSVLAFCDGETVVPMVSSQDHKRALDGDKGLNTGGMGTFSPSLRYTDDMARRAYETIFVPSVRALKAENRLFQGVLYFGLMIAPDGAIRVLEYNARFGDPETQVILPRLQNDLLDVFDACIDKTLDKLEFSWVDSACVCVVAASGGYPEAYETGKEITIGKLDDGVVLFHAGTRNENGKLLTNGGRVLGVTAMGGTLAEARQIAYQNIERISFEGMHYRKDICK